jgi:hypothetical protein
VNPGERDSFEVIFDLLRGIGFKITPAVDSRRVSEFLSHVGHEFGAEGWQSPPVGAASLTRQIECPAFKRVMKRGLFGKKKQEPTMKKEKDGRGDKMMVPDGIISHLTKTCRDNVHHCRVVEVTSPMPADDKDPDYTAQDAADLETESCFH